MDGSPRKDKTVLFSSLISNYPLQNNYRPKGLTRQSNQFSKIRVCAFTIIEIRPYYGSLTNIPSFRIDRILTFDTQGIFGSRIMPMNPARCQ